VKEKQPNIKKGSRVKIQLSLLYHIANPTQRVAMPSSEAKTSNIVGTIMNSSSSKGWDVQFDIFSLEDNIVRYITRTKLTVLEKEKEDEQYELPTDLSDYTNDFRMPSRARDKSKANIPEQELLDMPEDDIVTANTYLHQWDKSPSDTFKWDVLADGICMEPTRLLVLCVHLCKHISIKCTLPEQLPR
jgi:hypothetical protein